MVMPPWIMARPATASRLSLRRLFACENSTVARRSLVHSPQSWNQQIYRSRISMSAHVLDRLESANRQPESATYLCGNRAISSNRCASHPAIWAYRVQHPLDGRLLRRPGRLRRPGNPPGDGAKSIARRPVSGVSPVPAAVIVDQQQAAFFSVRLQCCCTVKNEFFDGYLVPFTTKVSPSAGRRLRTERARIARRTPSSTEAFCRAAPLI